MTTTESQPKAKVITEGFIAWCVTVFFMAQAMPILGVFLVIFTALYVASKTAPAADPSDERTPR